MPLIGGSSSGDNGWDEKPTDCICEPPQPTANTNTANINFGTFPPLEKTAETVPDSVPARKELLDLATEQMPPRQQMLASDVADPAGRTPDVRTMQYIECACRVGMGASFVDAAANAGLTTPIHRAACL